MYRNEYSGNARLIRMVPPGTLPDKVICDFDGTKNLLRIDSGYYEQATGRQQVEIWRSKSTMVLGRKHG